ncbi:MAG TPA: acyl-CoA dehydrogenase family protein [Actinomycetota bacterium]|nr:acyl-CoA dehydrogenase family protein [Actinomycetota bacterium]
MGVPSLQHIVGRADEVGRQVLALYADKIDREARWPEESIRALQEAGLAGLVVPEEFGGLGQGMVGLVRVCEILGKHCASSAISYGMHCVGAAVLAAKPTSEQSTRFLAPIAEGKHLTTLSLSEPGTGSHFYIPQARLTRANGGFKLNGSKTFVTNGSHADSYVVSAVAETDEGPQTSFTCVALPAGTSGLEWGEPWAGFGLRGNDARSLALRDVDVPAELVLGKIGDEMWYVLNVVAPYFLAAMSGTYLGIAAAAVEQAIAHLAARRHHHTGSALADNPILQHRVGSLWAMVERSRQLLLHAAAEADAGSTDASLALFASKAEVADVVESVTSGAMTLMGGIAYREHAPLQRLLRDGRAAHVMSPTTDMLRTWTGRWLLDRPIFGD